MGSHALCGMQRFMKYVVLVCVHGLVNARRFVFADIHQTCQMVLCRMQGKCCRIPSLRMIQQSPKQTIFVYHEDVIDINTVHNFGVKLSARYITIIALEFNQWQEFWQVIGLSPLMVIANNCKIKVLLSYYFQRIPPVIRIFSIWPFSVFPLDLFYLYCICLNNFI